MSERIQAVKGMNDLLPPESAKWQHVEAAARNLFQRFGYSEIRAPIVESTQLFSRAIGVATDIVEKEMYTFADRDDKSLTLRPEGTAGVVRAVLENQLLASDGAVKLYYSGPMFRRERPQKGRYRQFYQFGAEVLGLSEPTIDAEVIAMLVALFQSLGIADVDVLVNSVGGEEDRPVYRAALLAYFDAAPPGRSEPRRDGLCENCQRRLAINPLRVLDCKVPNCIALAADAPTIREHLGEKSRAHFDAVLEHLRPLNVKFSIDERLVRGLDYYTGTVFEVRGRSANLGAQNALCGGGRYDKLVEQLGGPHCPAIGFAFGIERVASSIDRKDDSFAVAPTLFLASQNSGARGRCMELAHQLRLAGISCDIDHRGGSLKSQFRRADKLAVRYVGVIGETELADGSVMLKNMRDGTQQKVDGNELAKLIASD